MSAPDPAAPQPESAEDYLRRVRHADWMETDPHKKDRVWLDAIAARDVRVAAAALERAAEDMEYVAEAVDMPLKDRLLWAAQYLLMRAEMVRFDAAAARGARGEAGGG